MKTKVILMALLMNMSSVFPTYSMGDESLIIILTEWTVDHSRPRSGVPISASIDDGLITTVSNTYSGTVSVTIKDEEGDTVLSKVMHPNGKSKSVKIIRDSHENNKTILNLVI